jgi:hypothetical protein
MGTSHGAESPLQFGHFEMNAGNNEVAVKRQKRVAVGASPWS